MSQVARRFKISIFTCLQIGYADTEIKIARAAAAPIGCQKGRDLLQIYALQPGLSQYLSVPEPDRNLHVVILIFCNQFIQPHEFQHAVAFADRA